MAVTVKVVRSIDDLLAYESRWQTLADNAYVSNFFYEPMLFIPAYKFLTEQAELVVLFVEDNISGQLIGFFPLNVEKSYRHLPIKHYTLWHHPHCFSAVPLIALSQEAKCIDAFLSWLKCGSHSLPFVRFPFFAAPNESKILLVDRAKGNKCYIETVDHWERAVLSTDKDSHNYFSTHYNRKRNKEYKRIWRRLSELGTLEFFCGIINGESLNEWARDFLKLENSGWKSAAGGGIAGHQGSLDFFNDTFHKSSARGALAVSSLRLNGKMIAGECSFVSGQRSIMLKITYDESYAKYSPGVLLVLKKTESLLDVVREQGGPNTWADSCAIPNHPMINHLWKQSLEVADFSVSSGKYSSYCLLFLVAQLVKVKRLLYR